MAENGWRCCSERRPCQSLMVSYGICWSMFSFEVLPLRLAQNEHDHRLPDWKLHFSVQLADIPRQHVGMSWHAMTFYTSNMPRTCSHLPSLNAVAVPFSWFFCLVSVGSWAVSWAIGAFSYAQGLECPHGSFPQRSLGLNIRELRDVSNVSSGSVTVDLSILRHSRLSQARQFIYFNCHRPYCEILSQWVLHLLSLPPITNHQFPLIIHKPARLNHHSSSTKSWSSKSLVATLWNLDSAAISAGKSSIIGHYHSLTPILLVKSLIIYYDDYYY